MTAEQERAAVVEWLLEQVKGLQRTAAHHGSLHRWDIAADFDRQAKYLVPIVRQIQRGEHHKEGE